jgi:hypothetical protein
MAGQFQKLRLQLKAIRQLGWAYIGPYLNYQFKLRAGLLRWKTPTKTISEFAENAGRLNLPVFSLPEFDHLCPLLNKNKDQLLSEADELVTGKVHLFGGEPIPLRLTLLHSLTHWTAYKSGQVDGEDIKLVWEPGRFGWALTLARAHILTKEDKYAETFWQYTETFFESNPPNAGPHWASGQEVALRLIAFSLAASIFLEGSEPEPARQTWLAGIAAAHAARILPTLDYARAQNNNHLISEAVGLYTAATLLPDHPQAVKWQQAGWEWLHHALQTQIEPDGTYIQHSTNYHRLMLQAALFARQVAASQNELFPAESRARLAAAVRWLLAILDQDSGRVPNLGGNDGAYILPLTGRPYHDFRPVLQAAGHAFLGNAPLPPDIGEEMTAWLGGAPAVEAPEIPAPALLRLESKHSWAILRAANFKHRPAHADQLHLDLWWRGHNITQDAGVYQYNAAPPWQNPLDTTAVHNTLTLNSLPQMSKAGRFLWLDWAQAEVMDTGKDARGRQNWAVVQHNGYRHLNALHRRMVSAEGAYWIIRDQVWPLNDAQNFKEALEVRLHWLVPDWPWTLENSVLRLDSGYGDVVLDLRSLDTALRFSLARAGENLLGDASVEPHRGWVSPTYAHKVPALSLAVYASTAKPLTLTTRIELPD